MLNKSALLLGLLIPVGFAISLPASAMGPGQHERPGFAELDANSDGQITLEEMQAHRATRFAARDLDGDGALSRDELLADAAERAATRVDRLISRFDANEDGMLSAEELSEHRRRGRSPERIFNRMDADGDGVVSEAEFTQAVETMRGHRRGHRNDG